MDSTQFRNAKIIRDEKAIKSPLVAKDVVQKVFVAVRWNPVNLIVGSHHSLDMSLFNGCFKRLQKIFPNHALRIVAGPNVSAALGLAMYGEVFRRRNDMRLVDAGTVSLQTTNCRHTYVRNKIGIFTIRLFGAAPARIASELQHRCQALLCASGPDFPRDS